MPVLLVDNDLPAVGLAQFVAVLCEIRAIRTSNQFRQQFKESIYDGVFREVSVEPCELDRIKTTILSLDLMFQREIFSIKRNGTFHSATVALSSAKLTRKLIL